MTTLLLFQLSSEAATLTLAWDPPTGGSTAGYVVRFGTAPGTYTQSVDVGSVTSYSFNALSDGVTYFFAVQAYDENRRYGPLSEELGALTRPGAPLSLAANVSGSAVNLSWRAPSGIVSGYRIEVGTSSGQSNVRTINTGAVTTYSVSGLAAGRYYIRVRSVNAGGTSGPSNEVTVTLTTGSGLAPPSNLRASVTNGLAINLQWTASSSSVDGYRIEVGTGPGQSNVRTTRVSASTTTTTISDLRGGPYYIRVRSLSGTNSSLPSNEVQVLCAPSAPLDLTASLRGRRSVDLAWQAPLTGASSYTIEVGSAPGARDVRTETANATNHTLRDLSNGVYYIRVRAGNSAGMSGPSNEVTQTIGRGKPAKPRDLTATSDGNLIALSWRSEDDNADFYRVEIGTTPGQTDLSSVTTGLTTTFTTAELPARTYYVRVLAGNDHGLSDPTQEVLVPGVGRADAPRRLSAIARGNGMVRLMWDEPEDASGLIGYRAEVGTGPGRTDLMTGPSAGRSLTGGPLPNGVYFVRVRALTVAGAGSASNEVVVQVGTPQQCTAAPAVPRLSAQVVGTMVTLSWGPGVGEAPTGYVLDVGPSPGRRDLASLPLRADMTTMTVQARNGSYALRLIAVNACGASAWGADASVTVGSTGVDPPGAPSDLVAHVNGRAVTLAWTPPNAGGAVTSYMLEVVAPTGAVLLTLDTGSASTTFARAEVPSGQYAVRVRGVNASGAGAASNLVAVTVP